MAGKAASRRRTDCFSVKRSDGTAFHDLHIDIHDRSPGEQILKSDAHGFQHVWIGAYRQQGFWPSGADSEVRFTQCAFVCDRVPKRSKGFPDSLSSAGSILDWTGNAKRDAYDSACMAFCQSAAQQGAGIPGLQNCVLELHKLVVCRFQ